MKFITTHPKQRGTLNTIVVADEGTKIRGDDLANIFQEARETGVTVSSLLPKLKGVSVQTMVTPASGVVEQAPRSGGRGSKRTKR
jgi:hypothetical protein